MRIFLLPIGVSLAVFGFGASGIGGGVVLGLGVACLACWWVGEQEWEEEEEEEEEARKVYTCK